jgi:hypothetical protein
VYLFIRARFCLHWSSLVTGITTLCLPFAVDILGVLELKTGHGSYSRLFAGALRDDLVAGIAVARDGLSIFANVLAVVASETAAVRGMT